MTRDSEDPLEDRVPGVELVGESLLRSATMVHLMDGYSYSLMELPGDGLAGEKTTLTD